MLTVVNLKLKRHRDIVFSGDFPKLCPALVEDFIKNWPASVVQKIIGDENHGILSEYFFSGLFYSHSLLKQLKRLDGIISEYAYLTVENGRRQFFPCVC